MLFRSSRFLNKKTKVPKYRKFGIKTITTLTNIMTNENISDSQSGFRAYGKIALDKLNLSEYGMGISTEILMKASKLNLKIKEVPITVSYDGDTSTHNPVSHGASVVLSTMKFVSIEHPLKFYGIPGIVFLGVGLFFTIWTIDAFGSTHRIFTDIAIISVGTILFGVILLITSILLFSLVNVVREKRI